MTLLEPESSPPTAITFGPADSWTLSIPDNDQPAQKFETKRQHDNTASKDDAPSRNPFDTTVKSSADQSASQPYGDALRSRSEFLEILLCYDNGKTIATAVSLTQRQSAISDVSNSPVNFTYVLSLVSCYLRIIGIFESLLRQLNELQCRKRVTPPDYGVVSAGLPILPDLHLAGISVDQGSLQTKILIQAIKHQFELIERSLGLPVELRVSYRRDDYYFGLLHNEWARRLL